ncbi:hypothetical protein HPP92_010898 [Vanilla planifolia]|uniref:Small G protein signalling modulator 1/2 Rab-binding domain-containing protein n=1 Tax=Vanilla planifolia TaxID=51239 RepID=A0A835V1A1_VANPL|nr:hypothetical protein HPP92_010898 [Vanilla planifolia]
MHEADVHDLSDDPDYAASQNQEATSNLRSDSVRMGDSNEAEVVYSKENVAVHPSQYASERISGRIHIIKQGESLFLTWIPKKAASNVPGSLGTDFNSSVLEKDRILYTIKPVPLSDIHSIRRHVPTLGLQYIIVVLFSGIAFPPLYFYNGGVREFLATLKQHVFIVRSADDSNVFLLNNFEDPLQKSLSTLELPRVLSVANTASMHNSPTLVSSFDDSMIENGVCSSGTPSEYKGRRKHKAHDTTHDLSIQVLEKFSLVTKFAREATTQLFREFQDSHDLLHDKKQKTSFPGPSVVSQPNGTPSKENDAMGNSTDPEFEKLSLVWGKQRQPPLNHEEWENFLDSEGRIMDSKALRKRIFYGGVEHKLRKEVLPFCSLFGNSCWDFYEYDSTYAEGISSICKENRV